MIRSRAAALVLVVALAGCKKKSEAPHDAGLADIVVSEPAMGVELTLPPSWVASRADAGEPGLLLDARRTAGEGERFGVAPRVVVRAEEIAPDLDADALARRTIGEVKAMGAGGEAKILRTTTGRRTTDGVDVAEAQIDYAVMVGGGTIDVVHKTFVARRDTADGKPMGLSITVTYLAKDDEALGREVEHMLRSLRFPRRPEE